MATAFGWFFACLLVLAGGCLVLTAPLSRLGLGEPGTGMSDEEFDRINAEAAASPWTPVPYVAAGLVLMVLPPLVMIRVTRKTCKLAQGEHGGR